jgi:hypothetical protein
MKAISRRTILVSGGAVAGTIGVLAFPPVRNSLCAFPLEGSAITWNESAVGIGRRCVAEDPGLTRDIAARRWAAYQSTANADGCTPEQRDFAMGRTSIVDGWILADSEITVFVAAYYQLNSPAAA